MLWRRTVHDTIVLLLLATGDGPVVPDPPTRDEAIPIVLPDGRVHPWSAC